MCKRSEYRESHSPQPQTDTNISNYFEIKNPFPSNRGAFSEKERCLYGHTVNYYMINYAKQFWEKYSNNKKYFRMAFNYGHEKTGAVNSYLDEPLYDFFFELFDKGYFDNTALFIVSNNGNHNNGIYDIINYSEFELEKKMGTFFLILCKNIKRYEEHLFKNQQIMVTPYDIHDTMIHVIYGETITKERERYGYSVKNKGESMFKNFNGKDRNCEKYRDDWRDKRFCRCSK